MYRTSALPEGACPRCYEPLKKYRVGHANVLGCSKCGGAFLDNIMSQELVRTMDSALAQFATGIAVGKPPAPREHVDVRLSCPRCGRGLAPVYVQSAATRIDACAEHGTWFDVGELLNVGRAFKRARNAGVLTHAPAQPSGASATIGTAHAPAPPSEPAVEPPLEPPPELREREARDGIDLLIKALRS